MNILKSVIHDTKTNSVEVTWVDADGKQVKCHSYADVQMGMFRADVLALGGNIADHEALIAMVEAAIAPYVAPPDPPITVSPRQIRKALTMVNLRSQVESYVVVGTQDLKDWWEFATLFEENHPMVVGAGAALGVSSLQVHEVFALASTL